MYKLLCGLIMTSLPFSAGSCFSQDNGGVDQTVAAPVVQKLLSHSQMSGSLEYWGVCDTSKPRPDFPKLRPVSGDDRSALDALREMFADDTKMRVTQDSDGKVRMVETDVPRDLLEVKIHHLSFPSNYHGPKMALMFILQSQEVMHFVSAHNLVPAAGWGLPGDDSVAINKPSVPGELNDVTVEQALDYILRTFPGFWSYQNCYDTKGARAILFGFYNNRQSR